jgi:hypothetical protein
LQIRDDRLILTAVGPGAGTNGKKEFSIMKKFILVAVASVLLQISPVSTSAHAAGPAEGPAAAERVLRTVLEEARMGTINISRFENDIAADVRENAGAVSAELKRRGQITRVEYLGKAAAGPGELYKFKVQFEKGQMLWSLNLNDRGKIANIDMQAR